MKGRESKGALPTDLLVCFPSRAHLTLMPKSICSPARPTEPTNRYHHHHHLTRSNNRCGQASPLLWSKTKPIGSENSEPTSPKVTCAGQIKVRQKPSSCKNWQSVMEEIERLHDSRKHKKRPSWVETLGLKKDIMQFLTCMRSFRLDLRCFGYFHESDITSDDEEDEDEDEEDQAQQENQVDMEGCDGTSSSRTVFSKWFMILQENQNNGFNKEGYGRGREEKYGPCDEGSGVTPAPPSNALLLMRCRSAPEKSWLKEKEEEEAMKAKLALEEEKKKESLVLMSYAPDFFKLSSDIAKETWVVGGMKDPLSRSRSSRRG